MRQIVGYPYQPQTIGLICDMNIRAMTSKANVGVYDIQNLRWSKTNDLVADILRNVILLPVLHVESTVVMISVSKSERLRIFQLERF
jgi:hypothetical protein